MSAAIGHEGIGDARVPQGATQLDAAGVSARVAADTLGHLQVSMTMDTYYSLEVRKRRYYGRNRAHDVVADIVTEMLAPIEESATITPGSGAY